MLRVPCQHLEKPLGLEHAARGRRIRDVQEQHDGRFPDLERFASVRGPDPQLEKSGPVAQLHSIRLGSGDARERPHRLALYLARLPAIRSLDHRVEETGHLEHGLPVA